MHLVSVESTHRWEESQLTNTPWSVSMPNHGLQLTRSKVVNVRKLQLISTASFVMPTESLHKIGHKN